MNLLYIADNGFSCHEGKYFCTCPNYVNLQQYGKYFSKISVIARNSEYQTNSYEMTEKIEVRLIRKNGFLTIYKEMKELSENYEVVLLRNGINGCFASFFSRFLKKPSIAYCGADPYEFQRSKGTFLRRLIAPVWRELERMKMKNATYAQYCTEYLYRNYPTDAPYLICSNVDINIEDCDLERRVQKINKTDKDKIRIGMIGRLDENKGVRTVIQALAELGERYSFEFIGSGKPDIFIRDIEDYGVGDRIVFLGYCADKSKLKEWLREIDIYVQPSLSEGLPRSTIEAMATACPCVATNIAGLPDILNSKYLIKPKDYQALAEKIRLFAENRGEAISAAEENFESAKKFDKHVRDTKLDNFYLGIVNNEIR